jgi:DNA (cytosine-5)-methyltransferase 1
VSRPRIGSLCSGYGGLDLAAIEALGAGEVAWHAQWEPPGKDGKPDVHQWAARVLAERFPGVPNHGDITAIDFRTVEPVDVLTAGFPCTDVSLAGLGAGLAPGTRSGIWSHVARAVAVLRPRLVFIENVRSLTSARAHSDLEPCPWCLGDLDDRPVLRALGAVLGDLADLGLDAEWICLPASAVGAPHERFRCFIAAWPAASDPDHLGPHRGGTRRAGRDEPAHRRHSPAHTAGSRLETRRTRWTGAGTDFDVYIAAVTHWERVTGRPVPAPTDQRGRLTPEFTEWMMGLATGWVTAVPGITRAAAIKALGNGVVPLQGATALRILAARAEPLRRILDDLQHQAGPALLQAA